MKRTIDSPDAASTSAHVDYSGSSSGAEYEVFLSFRGADTRLSFTDSLYYSLVGAGIRVFRDDEEIQKGEKIGGELLSAIESSKIYVPIFSRNYASSARCLRELTHMVKRVSEATDNVILPIFYDVKRDEVKLKDDVKHKSLYLDDLEKFSHDDVQQWKDALTKVARIKGWNLQKKGHGEIIHSVVSEVFIRLMKSRRLVHDQVKAFMNLLQINSHDVQYLVIHEMDGINKTTLAKVVFYQISNQFQGCSFLSNVHEFVQHGRIMDLQKKMLSELCLGISLEIHDSVHAGINIIRERFHDKKVLIVLDDVNRWDQLSMLVGKNDWFGPGSKIIITTSDIYVFSIKEEDKDNSSQAHFEEFKFYEMTEMDYLDALQLFRKRAIERVFIPNYDTSRKFISKFGKFPLALEILGPLLQTKSKRDLKSLWEKLDSVPKEDVFNILKISYDSLDRESQQIFLDIACFFIGKEELHPKHMWTASYLYPYTGIAILFDVSLIKMVENNKLWMPDQIRDFGREIVRREDVNVPKNRSRLWEPTIALDVIRMKEEAYDVEALRLKGLSQEYNFTSEEFSMMQYLRLLELESGNLVGDFNNLLFKLKWLSWSNCPSELNARNLCLKNLVVLELSGSNITEDWAGWGPCLVSKHLKVIQITQCPNLRRIPDVSKCSSLERLVLQGGKTSLVAKGSLSKLVVYGFCQD